MNTDVCVRLNMCVCIRVYVCVCVDMGMNERGKEQ